MVKIDDFLGALNVYTFNNRKFVLQIKFANELNLDKHSVRIWYTYTYYTHMLAPKVIKSFLVFVYYVHIILFPLLNFGRNTNLCDHHV